jgi:acyl-coenzyme A synthetase/AMP-(fatty) acid ligase
MRAVRGGCSHLRQMKKTLQLGNLIVDIKINDPIDYWIASLSCLHEGLTSLTSWPNCDLPEYLKPTAVITDQIIDSNNSSSQFRWPSYDTLISLNSDIIYKEVDLDNIAKVFFTSGTTGTSKAVALNFREIVDRSIIRSINSINYQCILPLITAHSSSGFQSSLKQWALGHTLALASNIEDAVSLLSQNNVQNIIISPNVLKSVIELCEQNGQRIDTQAITVLGSNITPQLYYRLYHHTDATIYSQYGTTETGTCALTEISSVEDLGKFGVTCPGVKVEVVDEDGIARDPGESGLLRIRTPFMTNSYVSYAPSAYKSFYGNWFYPGDLAMVDPITNHITILGKEGEIHNIGGSKIQLPILDDIILSYNQITDAVSFVVSDDFNYPEVWAAITSRQPIKNSELISYIESKLGPPYKPQKIIVLDVIPRTYNGKIKRELLHKMTMRDPYV